MNAINPYDEVLLVVDQDQRFKDAQKLRKKIDPEREAETLNTLVKVLGRQPSCYALVSEQDELGLKAYKRFGYEVVRVSENRGDDVNRFIARQVELLRNGQVGHLVLVTGDSTFAFLANQVDPKATKVSIWSPRSSINREIMAMMPHCDFRNLDEMLPVSPKVAVLIDFENIWFGLQKRFGRIPETKAIIDAILRVGNESGEIKILTAYADWDVLAKESHRNIQRELVELDVETHYLISIRGKNTADMRVANEVRDIVERGNGLREDVDVIVLATGDRDFRDIVKTAMERGKEVVILAVRNGTSVKLINVASEVRYIDDLLELPIKPPPVPPPLPPMPVRPWSKYALEVAKLAKQAKAWIPLSDLPAIGIQKVDEFVEQASRLHLIKLEKGTEGEGTGRDGLRLNGENHTVIVVRRMVKWVPDRIAFCLKQKRMTYIGTAFLAKGMKMDRTFQEWGVGQQRPEANRWLDLLRKAGVIRRKVERDADNSGKKHTSWWLPEKPKVAETTVAFRQNVPERVSGPAVWPTSQPSQAGTREEKPKDQDPPGSLWTKLLGSPA